MFPAALAKTVKNMQEKERANMNDMLKKVLGLNLSILMRIVPTK